MKYIFLAVTLFSSLGLAKESYCQSKAGKTLTLMQTNEVFMDKEFQDIRVPLFDKCKELEAKSVPLKELTAELHQTCYTLVKDKISGAQANAKYRRACDMGAFSSDAYIEGLEHGRVDCKAPGTGSQKGTVTR